MDRGHKTHAVTLLREHAAIFWRRNETTRFLIKNLAEKPVAPRRSIPLVFLSFLVSRFSVNRRIFVKFWHEECFAGAEKEAKRTLVRATGSKREPSNVSSSSCLSFLYPPRHDAPSCPDVSFLAFWRWFFGYIGPRRDRGARAKSCSDV